MTVESLVESVHQNRAFTVANLIGALPATSVAGAKRIEKILHESSWSEIFRQWLDCYPKFARTHLPCVAVLNDVVSMVESKSLMVTRT